jgi:hypothetical protein
MRALWRTARARPQSGGGSRRSRTGDRCRVRSVERRPRPGPSGDASAVILVPSMNTVPTVPLQAPGPSTRRGWTARRRPRRGRSQPGQRGVVRSQISRRDPECHDLHTSPLDTAARTLTHAVGVRSTAWPAPPGHSDAGPAVQRLSPEHGQIELFDQIDHEPLQVVPGSQSRMLGGSNRNTSDIVILTL